MGSVIINPNDWASARAAIESAKPKETAQHRGPGPYPALISKPYTNYDDSCYQIWADEFVIKTLNNAGISFTDVEGFTEWKKRFSIINTLIQSAENTPLQIPSDTFFDNHKELDFV